jgi:hypothetical protein
MSFHKKILLSFLIFHFVFTFSVLVFEYLLASSGAYDDYGIHFSLVAVFQIALMSALSVALVVIAYVCRFVWSHTRQRRQRAITS